MARRKIKKLGILFLIICTLQLFYIFQFRSGFQYEVIKNPFKKDSGINFAVSPLILETSSILKSQKAKNFNLSEAFKKSAYLYQRTIEFNYPIRMQKSSNMFFYLKKENVPDNCEVIISGEYIKFIKC